MTIQIELTKMRQCAWFGPHPWLALTKRSVCHVLAEGRNNVLHLKWRTFQQSNRQLGGSWKKKHKNAPFFTFFLGEEHSAETCDIPTLRPRCGAKAKAISRTGDPLAASTTQRRESRQPPPTRPGPRPHQNGEPALQHLGAAPRQQRVLPRLLRPRQGTP